MRPKSVIHAERLYLLSTLLVLIGTLMAWTPLQEAYGAGLAAGVTALIVGLYLLLILFTTRRGSGVARWLLVALTVFGALSLLWQISQGQVPLGLLGVVNTVQVVLTILGAVLLFRPNAALWFARPHDDWEEDA